MKKYDTKKITTAQRIGEYFTYLYIATEKKPFLIQTIGSAIGMTMKLLTYASNM